MAADMGWSPNDLPADVDSALAYMLRKNYEKGVTDWANAQIPEMAKYKNAIDLQKRVIELQRLRIIELENRVRELSKHVSVAKPLEEKVPG